MKNSEKAQAATQRLISGVGPARNNFFGADKLRTSALSLVLGVTHHETENPLWPGEVQTPKRLYEMPLDWRRVLGGRLLGHG
ncbi:MAG: hypothetical protein JRF70_08305, partial [Deltaproteobacteria bacterium]|nr:hypothetical protein [Deltaproteobacteria bacterium]